MYVLSNLFQWAWRRQLGVKGWPFLPPSCFRSFLLNTQRGAAGPLRACKLLPVEIRLKRMPKKITLFTSTPSCRLTYNQDGSLLRFTVSDYGSHRRTSLPVTCAPWRSGPNYCLNEVEVVKYQSKGVVGLTWDIHDVKTVRAHVFYTHWTFPLGKCLSDHIGRGR